MQTPATKKLDALGLRWVGHEYDHDPANRDFGMEAATKLGVDPHLVFKTLVVRLDQGFAVGVIPVSAMLDLKALAGACGTKKAEMATIADAERITGYVHGGISPIGQRKQLPTVLDQSAAVLDWIYISGGRRGFDIQIAPGDLLEATLATMAPIQRG